MLSPDPLSQSTMILPVSSTPMTVPRVPTGGAWPVRRPSGQVLHGCQPDKGGAGGPPVSYLEIAWPSPP